MDWRDNYISIGDNREFICWDQNGEYIGDSTDKEVARQIIAAYTNRINRQETD